MPRLLLFLALLPISLLASPQPIPASCRAVLVAQPESWDSQSSLLQLYRRATSTSPWSSTEAPIQVHLGRRGLAWGRGLHPNQPGIQKKEGDKKSPAGLFELGSILYGYDTQAGLPHWRYRQVTDRDLWIEDPSSPLYNRHLILSPHQPFPPGELYHLMRQSDPAHALKLFIRHNAPPNALPGAGSAIFFHLCRGPLSVTTGCTSMEESDLRQLLQNFNPTDEPVYVLLPKDDYSRLQQTWGLPMTKP